MLCWIFGHKWKRAKDSEGILEQMDGSTMRSIIFICEREGCTKEEWHWTKLEKKEDPDDRDW